MAGRRLLDIVAIFNASRGVAQKHVALRARQLDVYNRTSTLAKAVKDQTDRVTETAKAASFLASRLNESGPAWASEAKDTSANGREGDNADGSIPSKASTEAQQVPKRKYRIEQDHFYERSMGNSTTDPVPKHDLEIQQEKADRYPLPDGTIPPANSNLNTKPLDHEVLSARPQDETVKKPLKDEGLKPASSSASTTPSPAQKLLSAESARNLRQQYELQIPSVTADALDDTVPDPLEEGHDEDSFYRKSTHTSPVLSSLPRVKLPQHTSSAQGIDSHLPEGQINSDSFYTVRPLGPVPAVSAVPAQDEVPEGVDTALFYSPRVARLLGGKTQRSKQGNLELKGVEDTPIEHTELAANKDQDTLNARTSLEGHSTVLGDGVGVDKDLPNTSTVSREVNEIAQDLLEGTNPSERRVRSVAHRASSLLMANSDSDQCTFLVAHSRA
jgi:aarF domain-containing kinase